LSLTLPAESKNAAISIDWLFKLYYTDEGANDWIGISSNDRIVSSNQYYGIVQDSGEISKELDLLNSKASVQDIIVVCANEFKNDTFSAELLHGTEKYLNRKVLIYEYWIDDDSTVLLFEGRLKYISHDVGTVTLTIEQWTPFDYIVIPNAKSDTNGVYVPVIYGNYTPNINTALADEVNMRPSPWHYMGQRYSFFAVEQDMSGSSNKVHVYDQTTMKFLPLLENIIGESKNGINSRTVDAEMVKDFYLRADEVDDGNTTITSGDVDNAVDNDADTYFTENLTVSGSGSTSLILCVYIPPVEGEITEVDIRVKSYIDINSAAGATVFAGKIQGSVDDGSTYHDIETRTTVGANAPAYRTTGANRVSDLAATPIISTNMSTIKIRIYAESDNDIDVDFVIYDVQVIIKLQNKDEMKEDRLKSLDEVYLGDDGLTCGYNGGSGLANLVHEVHRDIMNRYAGVDYADIYMANWTALNTARAGWDIRLWLLESEPIKDVLERLQFEGCFMFFFVANSDGSNNPGGKYIWVKDSYSSGDVTFTFDKKDYANLEISMTDFSEIVTKTNYQYDRHSATGAYRSTETYDNTTDRDLWNLDTNHFEEITLDYLVGSTNGTNDIYDSGAGDNTPNESIVLYYDNLKSEPKIMTSFEVLNPDGKKAELGDIIKVDNSSIDPYGETWSNLYFMVVEEQRSKSGMNIVGREVYRT